MHLPEPPRISAPWTCPGCHNDAFDLRRLEVASERGPIGQHCSARRRVCEGAAAVTERQRRIIRHLMDARAIAGAAVEHSTFAEAEEWIEEHSAHMMKLPAPPKLTKEQFMYWTRSDQ